MITEYKNKFQILTCTARICDQTSCKSEVDALTCPVDDSLSYVHAKDILPIPVPQNDAAPQDDYEQPAEIATPPPCNDLFYC